MGRFPSAAKQVAAIFIFFFCWEAVSRTGLVDPLFLPPFTKVLVAVGSSLAQGRLLEHTGISLFRALTGFGVAVIAGISLAILISGFSARLRLSLDGLLEFFSQTNPFILFHIIILFLGVGEATKVTIIAWACTWPILFNTLAGLSNVDEDVRKMARSFGLKRMSLYTKVLLPAAGVHIFTGLRLGLSYSLFMLIAAEMMGSSSGLGWFLMVNQENYNVINIFSAALVIAVLALILDLIFAALEKRLAGRGQYSVFVEEKA